MVEPRTTQDSEEQRCQLMKALYSFMIGLGNSPGIKLLPEPSSPSTFFIHQGVNRGHGDR